MSTGKWLCLCLVFFAAGWLAADYRHRPKPIDPDARRAASERAFAALEAEEARVKKTPPRDPKEIMNMPSMDLEKEEASPEKAKAKSK